MTREQTKELHAARRIIIDLCWHKDGVERQDFLHLSPDQRRMLEHAERLLRLAVYSDVRYEDDCLIQVPSTGQAYRYKSW